MSQQVTDPNEELAMTATDHTHVTGSAAAPSTESHLPAPGTWTIDPSHSYVGFVARHLVAAKVRGRFSSFRGVLEVAPDPEQSSVSVDVDVASIDTRDEQRDAHLRSPDFFDTDQFPTL